MCKPISNRKGLWEVRCGITGARTVRVFFGVDKGDMLLLHAFVKMTQRTPKGDLDLAEKRLKELI